MNNLKILKDGHIHSPYCPHGTKDSFELYVERALKLGLKEMTFTEHMPLQGNFMDEEFLKSCAPGVDETDEKYFYQLSPASLKVAAEQGLKIAHLETLLNKYGETPPPSLVKALNQWEQKGGQVKMQPAVILRVDSPQILKLLRESPAGRFVGDPLGPTAAIINPGAERKISDALAKLGYLSDIEYTLGAADQSGDQEL